MIDVLEGKKKKTKHRQLQRKDDVKTQEEGNRLQSKREMLEENHHSETLISDFSHPELWENKHVV